MLARGGRGHHSSCVFCRQLDDGCACKITEREGPNEDLDVFCVRQSPVTTRHADIEETDCSQERADDGRPRHFGSINFFVTVSDFEEVVARPVPVRRRERAVPHLDSHLQTGLPSMDLLTAEMSDATWNDTASAMAPVADERPKSRPAPSGFSRAPSPRGCPGDTKPHDSAQSQGGPAELDGWLAETVARELAGHCLHRSTADQLHARHDASTLAPIGKGEPCLPQEACDAGIVRSS